MFTLIARRLIQLIPTIFFVSVMIFLLQQLLPGDPALVMAGEEKDPAVIEQIRQRYRSTSRSPSSTSPGSGACCAAISARACASPSPSPPSSRRSCR